jgi:hypothetical protein
MDVFKKLVVFALATLAAVALILWSLDAFGFRSPVLALLLNWLAMSWVAIAGQAVHFSLPQGYYAINTFERTGQLYERLGVRRFKRLVRRGPLAMFSPTLRFPKDRTIAALRHLDDEMRAAETGHVCIFMLMLLFISAALLRGWFDAVGWMLAFNIIINGYPVMLQRYNRIKLQELIDQLCIMPGPPEGRKYP